jgi:Tim10/DDP family zinc finger
MARVEVSAQEFFLVSTKTEHKWISVVLMRRSRLSSTGLLRKNRKVMIDNVGSQSTRLTREQMQDFMRMYSSLVDRCFNSCINDFTSKAIGSKEVSFIGYQRFNFTTFSDVGDRPLA